MPQKKSRRRRSRSKEQIRSWARVVKVVLSDPVGSGFRFVAKANGSIGLVRGRPRGVGRQTRMVAAILKQLDWEPVARRGSCVTTAKRARR